MESVPRNSIYIEYSNMALNFVLKKSIKNVFLFYILHFLTGKKIFTSVEKIIVTSSCKYKMGKKIVWLFYLHFTISACKQFYFSSYAVSIYWINVVIRYNPVKFYDYPVEEKRWFHWMVSHRHNREKKIVEYPSVKN